jgi:hypothetical protein
VSELFNGRWKIDLRVSLVWDDATQRHVPDEVGQEIITINVVDDVQDYEVLYGDGPVIRMGYTSRYDDPDWVPYVVRSITGSAGAEVVEGSVADFKRRIKAEQGNREREFVIGKPYGLIRTVYADERTHYRVSRNPGDGQAQSIMLRRLAEDGESYVATVLDTEGIVYRIRRFIRA